MQKTTPSWTVPALGLFRAAIDKGASHDEAAQAVKDHYHEAASLSLDTVKRYMRQTRENLFSFMDVVLDDDMGEMVEPQSVVPPPATSTAIFPALELPYEDGVVWCDTHIPYHLSEMMNLSIRRAKALGLTTLYHGGDLFDMHSMSKFVSWGKNGLLAQRAEFDECRRVLDAIASNFDKIVLIPGNHDGGRFQYMTFGMMGFRELLRLALGCNDAELDSRFIIGENRWFKLTGSPWGDWRITHPQRAWAIPLNLAERLAWKFGENILTAHQHYLGARTDRFGRYVCCDGGHLQNEALAGYKTEVDSSHSGWTPGFVELVDGWPCCVSSRALTRV